MDLSLFWPNPVLVDPGTPYPPPVPVDPANPVPDSGTEVSASDLRQPQPANGRPSGPRGQGASKPKR